MRKVFTIQQMIDISHAAGRITALAMTIKTAKKISPDVLKVLGEDVALNVQVIQDALESLNDEVFNEGGIDETETC